MKRFVVLPYHPLANGMIERCHNLIVDALSKTSDRVSTHLVQNLPSVLWADQSNVYASIELTPNYLNCDIKPILLIELEVPTW